MCMVNFNFNFACEVVKVKSQKWDIYVGIETMAEIGTYMLETKPMAAIVSESCWQMLQCYKRF